MGILNEAKDLNLYKHLLDVFGEYCDSSPATGVDGLLDVAIERGKELIPKDKRGEAIITYIFANSNIPAAVHSFLNLRFCDLPTSLKPRIKKGSKYETVFWNSNGKIDDRIKSLLSWEKGKGGFWCDVEGNKVQILDIE